MRYKEVSVVYPRDMLRSHVEKYVDEVLLKNSHRNITVIELYYDTSGNEVLAYLYSRPVTYERLVNIS